MLIAAERTGRKARAIEIDPHYVDVAVRRWQTYTGKAGVLAATGQHLRGDHRGAYRRQHPSPASGGQPRDGNTLGHLPSLQPPGGSRCRTLTNSPPATDAGTAKTKPKGDYEVGYGKPPAAHRFKPGNNANPKGRRKGDP